MEMHNVPLRGIKVDPMAHELAPSEGTRPYLISGLVRGCATKCAFGGVMYRSARTFSMGDGITLSPSAFRNQTR
jgi:hypothetical protein